MKSTSKSYYGLIALLLSFFLAASCDKLESCNFEISPGSNAQAELQDALNVVEEGCKVELSDGVFEFTRTLTMDSKSDVRIEGRGPESTVLSFTGQIGGGDGLLITNSDNIVVMDLTIRDTAGDALKFKDSQSIVMQKVHALWSGEPSGDNGGYGLYPILSRDILIEECYVYGASDSGIYVGQSDKAIVRNSIAEGNVAGIEIENTTNADVYDNTVTDNAAGILVFDLPGLSQGGQNTRVFDNTITDNIRGNFAPGGIVSEVPAGTGILVLSTKDVEIFDNTLEENNVMGTTVGSYATLVELGLRLPIQDPNYDPFPANVYIHDNSYSRSNNYPAPEDQSDFGNLLVQSFGENPIPDIILDGVLAPGSGDSGTICMEDNSGHSFVNLNIPNDFPNNLSFDPSPAVEIDVPEL